MRHATKDSISLKCVLYNSQIKISESTFVKNNYKNRQCARLGENDHLLTPKSDGGLGLKLLTASVFSTQRLKLRDTASSNLDHSDSPVILFPGSKTKKSTKTAGLGIIDANTEKFGFSWNVLHFCCYN